MEWTSNQRVSKSAIKSPVIKLINCELGKNGAGCLTNFADAMSTSTFTALLADKTITAIGTTGNVTINKVAGTANIAIGAAAVTVTNSLVTANSIVLAVLRTADATLTFIKSVVPGAGSFVVTGNANATAATSVGFLVIN